MWFNKKQFIQYVKFHIKVRKKKVTSLGWYICRLEGFYLNGNFI